MRKSTLIAASSFNIVALQMSEGESIELFEDKLIWKSRESVKDLTQKPILVIGSLERYLETFVRYFIGPTIQAGSGPLQPDDEEIFNEASKKCLDKAKEMAESIEDAISQILERKNKNNLTIGPN